MKPYKKGCKGFTLIELLVVVAIVGLLASVAIPAYMDYVKKARSTQCHVDRGAVQNVIVQYYHDNPDTELKSLKQLVTEGYLEKEPNCPLDGEYVLIPAELVDSYCPVVACSMHYLPGLVPEEEEPEEKPEVLFSSDFDNMDSLTPLTGKWEIKDGMLVPTGGWEEHRLAFGDAKWTDYEMTVNAQLYSGWGYGIYYRADGERQISGYCFQYDPGCWPDSFLVRRVYNGREEWLPFQRVTIPDGFPVYSQPHKISITVEKDHHVIKVDGDTVLDFHDDTFTSGMAGFRSWCNSEVGFNNVNVTEID